MKFGPSSLMTFAGPSLLFAALLVFSTVDAAPSPRTGDHPFRQRGPTNQYCTPSSMPSCWPDEPTWSSLNSSVNGNLIKVIPWAASCFSNPGPFDLLACEKVRLGYQDGNTRGDQVGTTQMDNWAYCYTNQGEVGDCSISAATLGGQLKM